jgi:hypothetical protein
MWEMRKVYSILVGKLEGKVLLTSSRHVWEYVNKMYFREQDVMAGQT